MSEYRYWTGGDGTGGANNTNWTQSYNTIAAACAVAVAGDTILMHYTSNESGGGIAVSISLPAGVELRSVDKDSGEAYTPQGTSGGYFNTNNITFTMGDKSSAYGLTLRITGTQNRNLARRAANNSSATCKDGMDLMENTGTGSIIQWNHVGDVRCVLNLLNHQWQFGRSGQMLQVGCVTNVDGGGIVGGSVAITNFIRGASAADVAGAMVRMNGVDLSAAGTSVALIHEPASTLAPVEVTMRQCKLPSSYSLLGTINGTGEGSASIELLQCFTASVDGIYAYATNLGSVVQDTGVTYNGESFSLRITTTANASRNCPFVTKWLAWTDPPTTTVTPRLEILRDGSTTAYNNDEAALEVQVRESGGVVRKTDFAAPGSAGVAQANGSGLTDWAGESGSAWSGKLDAGSTVTPLAANDALFRVVVGAASATVYASPVPRT